MHIETATVRLVPKVCGNWSGATPTNPSNALTNVDSDTYATLTGSGAAYLAKFDYTQIPTGATVTSFNFRIKGESTSATAGSVIIYYCYNDSDYTSATSNYYFGTSAQTLTLNTTSTYNWARFIRYDPNYSPQFRITVGGATVKIYGAEIDVTYEYEAPDTHGIFNLILPRG